MTATRSAGHHTDLPLRTARDVRPLLHAKPDSFANLSVPLQFVDAASVYQASHLRDANSFRKLPFILSI